MIKIILNKFVEVKLSSASINYYESLGYLIPKFPAKWNPNKLTTPVGTKLIIKIEHLPLHSNIFVDYQCDYCGEIGKKKYSQLMISREIIQKDCCIKCKPLKTKETNLIKYGVTHTSKLESNKEKRKSTNLVRYGFEFSSQNKVVKEKVKNTFIDKYGVTSPAKNKEIKEKMKQTNLERYGGVSPTQNKEVRAKQIKTSQQRFGVDYPILNQEIKMKAMESKYENGNVPCSRQQKYIHDLFGGELNFPHGNSYLDIAFINEKIYLEVDLGGHKLQVKFGNITEDEYIIKERNRWYALYRKGWKEIRIISSKDKIPSDKKLIEMLVFAKNYLNTDRHTIKFLLDEGKVKTSQFEQDYDFGELRYIYKRDIDLTPNNAI